MPNYKAAFESASLDLAAIMTLLGFTSYPGIDPMLRAVTNLVLAKAEAQALREQVAALRARMLVVPERKPIPDQMTFPGGPAYFAKVFDEVASWNACLDELAMLNGKAVSEGLLRRLYEGLDDYWRENSGKEATAELAALLGEGKEVGDANPADA